MSQKFLRRVAMVAGALAACSGPKTSRVVLDKPEAAFPRTFQQVSNVVELSDGRIALAELHDRSFLVADFTTGDALSIGTHADTIAPGDPAPGKHKLPGYVLLLAGDTLGLVDFAAERTTLWTPAGEFVSILGGRGVGGNNQPLAYDARGNGFKEDIRSVLGGLEPGRGLEFDSLAVLRIARGDTVADTIARLKLPPWGMGQFGEQQKMVSTIFAPRDLFGVMPDGSLWAARATNNEVDWRSPSGTWTRGPARDYTKVPVPQEEKDAFLERLRNQMAAAGAPAGIELSYPFADVKSPFSAAQTNPAGEVWLQRSRAYGDSVPVWDVVGLKGEALRTVQLPIGATVAGFGRDGRVYLLLRGPDGRQELGRYVVK
jgi:hypothetical protein